MARYSDAELYAASLRYGREGAARVLGVSASWVGKRARQYAAANALAVPVHASTHPLPAPRVRPPDPWSHRRLADGGVRVREQVRQNRTWPPA